MLRSAWTHPFNLAAGLPPVRTLAAAAEMVERATADYPKPAFGLEKTVIDGREVEVREELVHETPFCRLLRFEREVTRDDPRVLIVAPLSGHHATLLRETVRELLPDHDVYITDWVDARMVPLTAGKFDLADYVDLVVAHLREIGPGVNILSVCQPAVPVLIATAMLAEADDPVQPASMVLISGPVDTRVNPSSVNQFARVHSLKSLEAMVIQRVPIGHPGSGRRVYPGILQLWSFMSLDPHRHVDAHVGLFKDVVKGELESADKRRKFYDEYFAVMDLPAEFYLETVQHVFHRHSLPGGQDAAPRKARAPRGHPQDGADDRRGRRGRHHHARADLRRARAALVAPRRLEGALPPGGGGALRDLQRAAVPGADRSEDPGVLPRRGDGARPLRARGAPRGRPSRP